MKTKQIAQMCMKMAESMGLRERDKGAFAQHIVASCLFGNSPIEGGKRVAEPATVATEPPVSTVETKPRSNKKKATDVKKLMEEKKPSKLLCRAGQKCICSTCEKPVYTLINDLYDGVKAEEFVSKFMPVGHGKLLPTEFRVRAVDGCVMTDCPVCDGDMTLVLWGKRPESDFAEGDVSSVGGV